MESLGIFLGSLPRLFSGPVTSPSCLAVRSVLFHRPPSSPTLGLRHGEQTPWRSPRRVGGGVGQPFLYPASVDLHHAAFGNGRPPGPPCTTLWPPWSPRMGVGGPPSPSRTCPRGGQWLGRVPTLRALQRLACTQSGGVSDTPAGDGALLSRGRNNEAALQNALFCSRLFWMSEKSRGALRGVSKRIVCTEKGEQIRGCVFGSARRPFWEHMFKIKTPRNLFLVFQWFACVGFYFSE